MPHRLSDPVAIDTEKQYGDFRDQLYKDGYAVVKGVMAPERAAHYVEEMTKWLEKFPLGFDRNDPKTWTEDKLPAHMKGGMYHGYAVSHEKFVWDARLEPGVLAAFEKIWGTNELLASFDGINYTLQLPEGQRKPSTPWPHVDQSPHLLGLQCIQGIINFAPNGPNDGGLVVLKRSQALNDTYFKTHSKDKKAKWGTVPDDWHGFDPEEVDWYKERGAEEVKVCADPGDLIVWDSRTVHWNVLPQSEQTSIGTSLLSTTVARRLCLVPIPCSRSRSARNSDLLDRSKCIPILTMCQPQNSKAICEGLGLMLAPFASKNCP
ncbi:hypothetical protein M409DRAFT_57565 [Zasmidium cellare ATCC 36951]|uniref:Phytanoyl-CoA dioxygenase n=1 Tax=Zasmidium cellare ATCC 36951 TaxID=1080233 RepID=A0A6A6CBH8_ZASCE|nr:uncharacterized protein M409DRAFT_57565 [Zasmidium cellare ATCC 36951]KAF2163272.1 hypothetical protein M409DRAFT_57565 [Zasmidium cellare ATCC 36951]